MENGLKTQMAYSERINLERVRKLVYGENAWQAEAYLHKTSGNDDSLAVHNWGIAAGEPGLNTMIEMDRMMQTVTHIGAGFEKNFGTVPYIAIATKHGNACGAAFAGSAKKAISGMLTGDLRAIHGGNVMVNFIIDEGIAEQLVHEYCEKDTRRLLDVVAAVAFTEEAVEILARKKGKCKMFTNLNIEKAGISSLDTTIRYRYVRGGFLEQPNYTFVPKLEYTEEDKYLIKSAIFAWGIGSTSNSNTITIVKDGVLVGNGVGQQDRVTAAQLALFRADEAIKFATKNVQKMANLFNGAVAYSDSFFPFPDAPEILINRGVNVIFSTSGSLNDKATTELCERKGIRLILLPDKEARGFYGH